ncbi:MAG: hypothetical protein ACKV19_12370 [Verrucomicrobiales bacterium]
MTPTSLTTPSLARWLAAALAIGAAFALGCLLRRWAPGSVPRGGMHASLGPPRAESAKSAEDSGPTPNPLTEEDFTAAAAGFRDAMAGNTPEHGLLAAAERLLLAARTSEDFLRLVELVNTVRSDALIEPIAMAAFTRWAQADPEAAARAVDRVDSHQLKHYLAREVCRVWARRDPEGALAFVESGPPGFARRLGPEAVFSVLAETDPESALARAREWKNESERSRLIGEVLRKWAASNPQEAIAFARAEPDPRQRADLLQGALSALPKESAWSEAAAFVDLKSPEDRILLRNILNGWSFKIEEPASAVLALPAGAARDELLQEVAIGAVMSDHQRAEALLDKMPDAATREPWIKALAQSHLRNGDELRPLDAIRLASQLPAGEAQTAVFREAGSRWSEHDAPAASQWLAAQPAGALRDAFLGEFVRGTFDSDPEAALTWSVVIADEAKRGRRLAELFPKWRQRDHDSALAWLRQQNLSHADRVAVGAP